MRAIVLSAGQGSRLLPLTFDRPKCLLHVGSRTVLQWQLEALCQSPDIQEIIVVTGFKAEMVDAALAALGPLQRPVRTLFNPFYKVADNLASCWMARDFMRGDFLIVNGDSLFEMAVLPRIIDGASAPINLTVNRKANYDSDDMKVTLDGGRVRAVGKTLAPAETHAESIGLVLFRGDGPDLFRRVVEQSLHEEWGVGAWYLQVIDRLAREGHVGATDIGPLEWGEIDFPSDLEAVSRLTARWEKLRIVA
ncbi:MAG: phosphocholine cytidylyltransferase family protein [Parvularculaceae bacterium]|jgi:choline kinase|nr:phosphocholine cytidylyltransferase family protein [Parvularculaceae bacterium]